MRRNVMLFITGLLFVIGGCSNDEKIINEESVNQEIDNGLPKIYTSYNGKASSFMKTDTIYLFTANNEVELEENMYIISSFNEEVEAVKEGYNETKPVDALTADLATYQLNFINKKAYITDLVFWNNDSKLPVDVIPYSTEPVYDWDVANCPEGWSGGSSYGSEEAVKTAMYNQMMKSFMQGNCVQFQAVKSLFSIKICYRSC